MTTKTNLASAPLIGLQAFAESLRNFARWQTFATGVLVVSEPEQVFVSRSNGKPHS